MTNDLATGFLPMRLPVRIVPRKGIQVFYFGFFLACALVTLPILEVPLTSHPSAGFYVFLVFVLPFIIIGVGGCLIALLKSLPRSPYYNVEINAEAFTLRRGFRVRRYRWSELAPFAVSAYQHDDGAKVFNVAVMSADTRSRYTDLELYHAALVNLGDYCDNDPADAGEMVEWLNAIRSAALERGAALQEIDVPYYLGDYAFELDRGDANRAQPSAPASSSVDAHD